MAYSSFYGAEYLSRFDYWTDEGEFFEKHFALYLPFKGTYSLYWIPA